MTPEKCSTGFNVALCFILSVSVLIPRSALADVLTLGQGAGKVHPQDESQLIAALSHMHENQFQQALTDIESLVRVNPNFKLAQLVYADLLLAKARPITALGGSFDVTNDRMPDLRDELHARLKHRLNEPPEGAVPESLLQLSDNQEWALVADVSESRLYLFKNEAGEPRLVGDYYVSTGKKGALKAREGDQKTPVGVYFVTRRLPSDALPDLYGSGALPLDYPNEWDRRLGRTGYGIWLHGVPSNTYSRSPRASDGCMALPNPDLQTMWKLLEPGNTPVIIADGVTWVKPSQLRERRAEFKAHFVRWRRDWESRNPAPYLRHYSAQFRTDDKDLAAWTKHKRRVNRAKRYIRIGISDLSLFSDPSDPDLLTATFQQDYRSSNYSRRGKKRQYWRRDSDGTWQIVYEGLHKLRPEHLQGMPFSARSRLASAR